MTIRPRTRGDCARLPRPCPFTDCRHHLATTCALDVVDEHPDGRTLQQIGELVGVSRERIRQVEAVALAKLTARLRRSGVDEGALRSLTRARDTAPRNLVLRR